MWLQFLQFLRGRQRLQFGLICTQFEFLAGSESPRFFYDKILFKNMLSIKNVSLDRLTLKLEDDQVQKGLLVMDQISGKKKPLVVYIHGHDFRGSWSGLSSPLRFKVFSGEYHFLFPTQMGYENSGDPDFCGPQTVGRIQKLVKDLVTKYESSIDLENIYLVGVSRGAIVAAMLVCRFPDTYVKAALIAGAYDLEVDYRWEQKDPAIKKNMETEMRTLNSTAFAERSALYNAESIQTPLLIMHGTEDTTIDSQQAVKFGEQLTLLGKDHSLVLVNGADHGVGNPATFNAHIWPFFEKQKKGG